MTQEQAWIHAEEEKQFYWEKRLAVGEVNITEDAEGYVLHSKEASPIVRLRRITGYVSPVTQWNNAKQGELRDRVKHM